jgi:anti-sigma factor RsiW
MKSLASDAALSCRDVAALVTDALEGALSEATRRRLEEHMSSCEGCRTFAQQIEQTVAVLRMLPREATPTWSAVQFPRLIFHAPIRSSRLRERARGVTGGAVRSRGPEIDLWTEAGPRQRRGRSAGCAGATPRGFVPL